MADRGVTETHKNQGNSKPEKIFAHNCPPGRFSRAFLKAFFSLTRLEALVNTFARPKKTPKYEFVGLPPLKTCQNRLYSPGIRLLSLFFRTQKKEVAVKRLFKTPVGHFVAGRGRALSRISQKPGYKDRIPDSNRLFRKRRKNRRGQGLVEYLILIALMGVATIGIIRTLNQTVKSRFANAIYALQGRKQKAKTHTLKKEEYQRSDLSNFMTGAASGDESKGKKKKRPKRD